MYWSIILSLILSHDSMRRRNIHLDHPGPGAPVFPHKLSFPLAWRKVVFRSTMMQAFDPSSPDRNTLWLKENLPKRPPVQDYSILRDFQLNRLSALRWGDGLLTQRRIPPPSSLRDREFLRHKNQLGLFRERIASPTRLRFRRTQSRIQPHLLEGTLYISLLLK